METTEGYTHYVFKPINAAIKPGLIMGAILIVYEVILYMLGPKYMVQFTWRALSMAILVGYIIYEGLQERKKIGGFMSYGNAFVYILSAFVVASLVSTAFGMLLMYVIDPSLPDKLQAAVLQNVRESMEMFNAPAEKVDETLEKMEEEPMFTAANGVKQYFQSLITWLILAALSALAVRKKKPEFV